MEKLMIPSNTSVRDFGYPNDHPLHNGVVDSDLEGAEYDEVDGASSYEEGQYSSDEINRKAVALFDFIPENDNEVALREGQLIWISYRHGQGWLVAEDPETGENGLVPEEYVEIWYDDVEEEEEDDHVPGVDSVEENKDVEDDVPKRFLPDILHYEEDEWVDTDDEDDPHLLPHPQSSHIRPKEEVVIE